jgi:hypothetical protein
MTASRDPYVPIGAREDLDRLLAEYGLSADELGDRIRVQSPTWLTAPAPAPEYLVHESVLRPHGDFPCAGDHEALTFCEEIVDAMVHRYGIARSEAVARVNRQWSDDEPPGAVPRIWIVGLDIVYHEDAGYWAADIYYGGDSRWWQPDARPRPLPPP